MHDTIMLVLHQRKVVLWTVLGAAIVASFATIHSSFQLVNSAHNSGGMDGVGGVGGVGPSGFQAPWRILDSLQEPLELRTPSSLLRYRAEAKEERADDPTKVLRQLQEQAFEIEQLKGALDEAKKKSDAPGLAASLRFLWKQLQDETPLGNTSQRVMAHLKRRDPSPKQPDDIVLVTHASLTKIQTILIQLEYWNGPASLALYMNQLDAGDSAQDSIDLLEAFLHDHNETLKDTSIHLLMEYTNSPKAKGPLSYPHNPLRNMAMDYSDSDFIVALDVDFIPNPPNCYSKLLTQLHASNYSMAKEMRTRKRIMVLPAFEVYAAENTTVATPDLLPPSKAAMHKLVKANLSESFRSERYPAGHAPTDFYKWFDPIRKPNAYKYKYRKTHFYPIEYRPGFEPYVLAYRPGLPRYWNEFRGFGQNKLSWFQELHRAGYLFGALWDFFVVHLQHPSTFNSRQRNNNVMKNQAFLNYLDEKYPLINGRQLQDRRHYYQFKNKKAWGVNNSTAKTKRATAKAANATTVQVTATANNNTSGGIVSNVPKSDAITPQRVSDQEKVSSSTVPSASQVQAVNTTAKKPEERAAEFPEIVSQRVQALRAQQPQPLG